MTPRGTLCLDQARPAADGHGIILSVFPGIDLFGRGFEAEGYCVVRGPDLLWGQHVEEFSPVRHMAEGVIGGSPCQNFSGINRDPDHDEGVRLLNQFIRIVTEADPQWFLMENVIRCPDIIVPGYSSQRFNLNAKECGCRQNRPRRFQFGSRDGKPLVISRAFTPPGVSPCALASEGSRKHRRAWPDFCELQGLPRDFDLPGWSLRAKYRAVGNGVPIPMARVIAIAIARRLVTPLKRLCICECGREVRPGQTMATAACRKRMQRKRDAAGVTGPGTVTPAMSLAL